MSSGVACDPTGLVANLCTDLVLLNGKVVTVDRDLSVVEAVAVKDGKIQAVGSTMRSRG